VRSIKELPTEQERPLFDEALLPAEAAGLSAESPS
jgi:hypothetical protein